MRAPIRSYSTVEQWRRSGCRRLLLAGVAFSVMFVVGIALVAVLAPRDLPDDDTSAAQLDPEPPAKLSHDQATPSNTEEGRAADATEAPPGVLTIDAGSPEAPNLTWWDAARGKKCKVMFGKDDRLLLREGRLKKDQKMTYGPFVGKPIVGRVRKQNDPTVTAHHFGIHPRTGQPSLADVTLHDKGKDVRGILPLWVSGDQIELHAIGSGDEP